MIPILATYRCARCGWTFAHEDPFVVQDEGFWHWRVFCPKNSQD